MVSNQLTENSVSGTCPVTATKAEDTNYNVATSAPATVTIHQATQTISFSALTNMHVGDADFSVSATGGASGQSVTFTAVGRNAPCPCGSGAKTKRYCGG